MTFKFKRKRLLLSEKNKKTKAIGYARATHNEFEYLEEQIKNLKKEGCSLVFSEFISIDEEIKPQLNKAINCLSKGDELIITQLDRAFKNKKECLVTINKLINQDIKLRTLNGFFADNTSSKTNSSIFKIFYELENLDDKNFLLNISDKHSKAGYDIMFDSGYGGEHWLASFAIYNFTR